MMHIVLKATLCACFLSSQIRETGTLTGKLVGSSVPKSSLGKAPSQFAPVTPSRLGMGFFRVKGCSPCPAVTKSPGTIHFRINFVYVEYTVYVYIIVINMEDGSTQGYDFYSHWSPNQSMNDYACRGMIQVNMLTEQQLYPYRGNVQTVKVNILRSI